MCESGEERCRGREREREEVVRGTLHQALIRQDPTSFNRGPVNRGLLMDGHFGGPRRPFKTYDFNHFGVHLGVQGSWRHTKKLRVKCSLWETLCSPSYDIL